MRKLFITVVFLCCYGMLWPQAIFSNTITGTNPNTSNPYTEGQITDPNLIASGIGRGTGITGSNSNNRYNASGWSIGVTPDENDYFEFILSPEEGNRINFNSFVFTGQASASGPVQFSLRSSVDGFTSEVAALSATGSTVNLTGSVFQNIQTTISFRIYGWGGSSTAGTFSINDFTFEGSVLPQVNSPLINIASSLNSFNSLFGAPSNPQSFSVGGSALTDDIHITAPEGYELSLNINSGYNTLVILPQSAGSVMATTVYVRQHSITYGINGGQIQVNSNAAVPQSIQVAGLVLPEEPATTSTIHFSNVSTNGFDINFTAGDGSGRIVIMKAGSIVNDIPVDGINYNSSPVFGSGQSTEPGEYVVYSGTGTQVQVSGLSPSTVYHVAVFEYNQATVPEAINYAANAVIANQITNGGLSGFQLSAMNTSFLIDFDHTSYEANNGQYNGTGFAPAPVFGQLSSGAWAVAGWTDGNMDFNETKTSGDYARGFTNTHPSTGGMYSFEPFAPGNRALGFQPGTNDWAPGTITLRIQNQTGVNLKQLGIAYTLYVFNNADRSSSFNISYSTDHINFTGITILDHSSPAAADPSPAWMMYAKTAEITGFDILPGQYLYIRWSSADVSGTGSRDEFALDDISVTGNPLANGPLPVRFTSLKAFQVANGIQLEFGNEIEENLDEYIIVRSMDGNHFIAVDTLKPGKNDGSKAYYRVIDKNPVPGNNFYRIGSVELNGNKAFSSIIRISTHSTTGNLRIYPNPVPGDELLIQAGNLSAGKYEIKIYDVSGRIVMQRSVHHQGGAITQNLTVSRLQPGWYSVQISGDAILRSQFIKW